MRRITANMVSDTTITITRAFPNKKSSYIGRIVLTDREGNISVINDAAVFYEGSCVFIIPYSYTTDSEGNLPATVELEIKSAHADWYGVGDYELIMPYNPDWNGDGRVDSSGGGTGTGGDVVFPSNYPLPTTQLNTLTPQKNAITNEQLRLQPVEVLVTNPPSSTGGLTNDELRDSPVDVRINNQITDYATNTTLVSILDKLQTTLNAAVSGTVALDAPTLAALESVTAAVSGTVSISNLPENQQISGTVSLDAVTLAALENISVSVANFPTIQQISGTVGLDANSLTALEQITATISNTLNVTGSVSVNNLPTDYPLPESQVTSLSQRDLLLSNDSVRQTLRASLPHSVNLTGPMTNTVLVSVPNGQRLRLLRNAGHVDPEAAPDVFPIITIKIGATTIYNDKLEAGLPWSETVCLEGADGEDLTISVSTLTTVYLNMRYELF